jgi:hypothetical protein
MYAPSKDIRGQCKKREKRPGGKCPVTYLYHLEAILSLPFYYFLKIVEEYIIL